MGIIKKYGQWKFDPRKGTDRPVPKKGVKRFFYLLTNHFWKLITVNFLFLLCCIPIITIPASLCAMNRYLIKMVRTGYGFDLSDFFKEFRAQIVKSLPFGMINGFLIFYAYYLLSYSPDFNNDSRTMLTSAVAWICLAAASLIGSYVFILLSMLDLKNRYIIKNALILILCEWKTSLFILVTVFTMGLVIFLTFPYSVVLLVLNWFSITQLMLCSIINPVVSKRIINPYMEKNKDDISEECY